MPPIHLLCLMHPGAAAAAATAVVLSMWVLEEWQEQDTAKPPKQHQQSREGPTPLPPIESKQAWEADHNSHVQDDRSTPPNSSSAQQAPAAPAKHHHPPELPTASVIHQPPPADYATVSLPCQEQQPQQHSSQQICLMAPLPASSLGVLE